MEKFKIDFFIVGAARCGTTTLYHHLKNVESIFLPEVKELNFFSNVESNNREDYLPPKHGISYHTKIIKSKEVYQSLFSNATQSQLKGDISPSYMWDKETANRIFNHNPEAKIIISLRNPVDRAFSHYIMNYFTGVDNHKSFLESLNSKSKSTIWGACTSYLEMGHYHEQIKPYYDLFPTENIKIIIYESWIGNIQKTTHELCNFLNIDYVMKNTNNDINTNKIVPLKNLKILNAIRHSFLKRAIKSVFNQECIDKWKHTIFSTSKKPESLKPEIRKTLLINYSNEIEKLNELTKINFFNHWK